IKLYTTNVSLRHYRRITHTILSLADHNLLVQRLAVKRMHEVTERPLFNILKQLMRSLLMNPVPTDMWHDQSATKPPHTSPQQPQSLRRSKLLRLIKQQLHSNTHTQQRRPLAHSFFHQAIEATIFQRLHARAKRADARQHQPLRCAQLSLIAADDRLAAHRRKRLLDRAQVANSIVDDRDTHNDPFVLGTPRIRLFRSTACRNARAEALNVPSRM